MFAECDWCSLSADENGHYVYLETSTHTSERGIGRLMSQEIPPPASVNPRYCLTFWYHVLGENIEGFYVKLRNGSGWETLKWSADIRQQKDEWNQGILLFNISGPFQVRCLWMMSIELCLLSNKRSKKRSLKDICLHVVVGTLQVWPKERRGIYDGTVPGND